jgi:heme-degrading monooxygenase HmoA
MICRLTFLTVPPDKVSELKRIYHDEVVPEVHSQKGNVNIHLLEPVNNSDEFVSLTEWETEADADAYESSGKYKEMVSKVRSTFSSQPILKIYHVEDAIVPAS